VRRVVTIVSTYPDAHHRCYTAAALASLEDQDSRSMVRKLVNVALAAVDSHAPGTYDGEGLVGLVSEVCGVDAVISEYVPWAAFSPCSQPFEVG